MEIKYSKNVVGCRIGEEIYLNPDLYNYPKLYQAILTHEKKHTESMTKHDFLMDLSNKDLRGVKKSYYKFIIKHPRTLLGFLPLSKVGEHWTFDVTLFIFWVVVFIILLFIR